MEPQLAVAGSELRQQVIDSFGRLARGVLRREVGDVTAETRLREDLGMTSTSILELLLELEDRLHIEIDVQQLDEMNVASVGALADYVVSHAQPAA